MKVYSSLLYVLVTILPPIPCSICPPCGPNGYCSIVIKKCVCYNGFDEPFCQKSKILEFVKDGIFGGENPIKGSDELGSCLEDFTQDSSYIYMLYDKSSNSPSPCTFYKKISLWNFDTNVTYNSYYKHGLKTRISCPKNSPNLNRFCLLEYWITECDRDGLLNPLADAFAIVTEATIFTYISLHKFMKNLTSSENMAYHSAENLYCYGKGSKGHKNLALNYKVIKSEMNITDREIQARNLVDGCTTSKLSSSCCTILKGPINKWIDIILLKVDYQIGYFRLRYNTVHRTTTSAGLAILSSADQSVWTVLYEYDSDKIIDIDLNITKRMPFNHNSIRLRMNEKSNQDFSFIFICELEIFSENIALNMPVYHSHAYKTFGANDGDYTTYDEIVEITTATGQLVRPKICVNLERVYHIFTVTAYIFNENDSMEILTSIGHPFDKNLTYYNHGSTKSGKRHYCNKELAQFVCLTSNASILRVVEIDVKGLISKEVEGLENLAKNKPSYTIFNRTLYPTLGGWAFDGEYSSKFTSIPQQHQFLPYRIVIDLTKEYNLKSTAIILFRNQYTSSLFEMSIYSSLKSLSNINNDLEQKELCTVLFENYTSLIEFQSSIIFKHFVTCSGINVIIISDFSLLSYIEIELYGIEKPHQSLVQIPIKESKDSTEVGQPFLLRDGIYLNNFDISSRLNCLTFRNHWWSGKIGWSVVDSVLIALGTKLLPIDGLGVFLLDYEPDKIWLDNNTKTICYHSFRINNSTMLAKYKCLKNSIGNHILIKAESFNDIEICEFSVYKRNEAGNSQLLLLNRPDTVVYEDLNKTLLDYIHYDFTYKSYWRLVKVLKVKFTLESNLSYIEIMVGRREGFLEICNEYNSKVILESEHHQGYILQKSWTLIFYCDSFAANFLSLKSLGAMAVSQLEITGLERYIKVLKLKMGFNHSVNNLYRATLPACISKCFESVNCHLISVKFNRRSLTTVQCTFLTKQEENFLKYDENSITFSIVGKENLPQFNKCQ
ncbi:DgyrCDS10752 [Dimorphilus gyrociliatus]|uniref:DgyrCDS10752 n=1 Tax=Dimorphilus gyrociliatus TaxID=2664684 RepID=A0A7I8W1A0_9ANNE|nr:DgyrCDS10752 [Dimorphilus gyrociliatus]